jgi:hypothetical protein
MSKGYPPRKYLAGHAQGISHVPQDKELGRRHTIRMRRNPALADVDFSIRKQLAQMVVGSAVAEPELKHITVQFLDEMGG